MSSTSEINTFVDAMLASQKQFEDIRLSLNKKNDSVTKCLDEFHTDLEGILSQNAPKNNNEALQTIFEQAHEQLGQLITRVATEIESTRKGIKFIRDYESSFNIAVFGKVKAGKSFLGNFIMGKKIRDLGVPTSYDKIDTPKVEVYDRGQHYTAQSLAEIKKSEDEFFVDPNEATSTIQLFKLGGMTWFDTPGIGSVTWENEMLAKDYVNNADLVVYASNSDASGQRQDFQEMKKLHDIDKRFLLLLTQSDTLEEDVDDEDNIISSLVAKSADERRNTEKYMMDELRKNGIALKEEEILTVSAKLALDSLAKRNEQLFTDSHMGDFLKILTEITQTEGAKLKLKTPGIRLNKTIQIMLEKISQTESYLLDQQAKINEQKSEIEKKNTSNKELMYRQCQSIIENIIHQKAQEVENAKAVSTQVLSLSTQGLSQAINKAIYEVVNQNCLNISKELASSYVNSLCLANIGELKQETETVKYTMTEVNERSRSPRGIIEHIVSLFGKEYRELYNSTKECEEVIQLGVNESQIQSEANQRLQELFNGTIDKLMQDVVSFYMEPLTKLHNNLQGCLERTKTELNQLLQC